MLKPIEQRVDDLEDLIADLPGLISLRMDSLTASLHETNGRLAIVDRQVSHLVRDVRDFRGAVTRQLIGQDERIAKIEAGVGELKADLGGLKADVGGLKESIAEILRRLPK